MKCKQLRSSDVQMANRRYVIKLTLLDTYPRDKTYNSTINSINVVAFFILLVKITIYAAQSIRVCKLTSKTDSSLQSINEPSHYLWSNKTVATEHWHLYGTGNSGSDLCVCAAYAIIEFFMVSHCFFIICRVVSPTSKKTRKKLCCQAEICE